MPSDFLKVLVSYSHDSRTMEEAFRATAPVLPSGEEPDGHTVSEHPLCSLLP